MDSVSSILMKLNDSDHSVVIHIALWVDHYVTYLEITSLLSNFSLVSNYSAPLIARVSTTSLAHFQHTPAGQKFVWAY